MNSLDIAGIFICCIVIFIFLIMNTTKLKDQNDQIITQNNQIILLLSPQNILDTSDGIGSEMIKEFKTIKPKVKKEKK